MRFTVLLSIMLIAGTCMGQFIERDVVASAGDFFTDGNYTLSMTLGEIMVETYSDANNFLTQGFQQPVDDATYVEELSDNLDISVFPNPFRSDLTIDLGANIDAAQIRLYDVLGKPVGLRISQSASRYTMNLSYLAAGSYYLTVNEKDAVSASTIKLIKL